MTNESSGVDALNVEQLSLIKNKFDTYVNINRSKGGSPIEDIPTDYIDQAGMCGGLSFVHGLFARTEDEKCFQTILELWSKWDGKENSLGQEAPVNLKKYYHDPKLTTQKVFEQFINDIVWFMHALTANVQELNLKLGQRQRAELFDFVKQDSLNMKVCQEYVTKSSSKEKIAEIIKIYSACCGSDGLMLDVTPKGHFVSLYIRPNNH